MKIFHQIIIICFIVLSIFIYKNDIESVLTKIYLSFNKENNQTVGLVDKKEIELQSKTDTPGALRVPDNFLSAKKNINLSKDKVIEFTNKRRSENGNLKPLSENLKLDLSAEKKLQDMFNGQYFEHTSPSGVKVGDLGEEVGYEYILIGENLALGNFKDDEALVDAWMASPGHRANILNEHYKEIGVVVGSGIFEGRNVWLAVQHFGTPRSVCSAVDTILYSKININQAEINKMNIDLSKRNKIIKNGGLYEGSTHKEQIDKYNNLVKIYNNLILDTKEKINEYNLQIKTFNACLLANQ
jgi:uncharacterized protein YkwD